MRKFFLLSLLRYMMVANLKNRIQGMKDTTDSEHCGIAKLSNTCEVTVHFCMEANGDCYFSPNYGQEG